MKLNKKAKQKTDVFLTFFPWKKGSSQIWWIIMAVILALVVVALILVWFSGSGGKLFTNLDDTTEGVKDFDGDGYIDLFEKDGCVDEVKNGQKEKKVDKDGCVVLG